MARKPAKPHPIEIVRTDVPAEAIEQRIFLIRGQKVMLDSDLAELYGVETKALKRAVKRNIDRFPADFMFQLTREEVRNLRYHFGTSSWGGQRYLPFAFTEHGAVMLASVLNSPIAAQASIQVVRAFIRLRGILAAHKELAQKLEALENRYDAQFKVVFDAIRKLMEPTTVPPNRRIGFLRKGEG